MRNLHAVFLAVDPHLHAVHTFTFGGTHGGSTTPENGFLSPDSLRWSVSDGIVFIGVNFPHMSQFFQPPIDRIVKLFLEQKNNPDLGWSLHIIL